MKIVTNYEHIKGMSVEEIEGLLRSDCKYCIYRGKDCIHNSEMQCTDGVIKWLNSEVEE